MSEAKKLSRRLQFWKRRRAHKQTASMSMMEHLTELRQRLISSLVGFLLISIVAFIFFEPISDFLLRPLCKLPPDRLGPNGCRLIFTGAMEPISVRLKVTAMVGIVGASPLWLYHLWAFVVPGLTPKEKRYAFPFVGSSILLFAFGATFAYLSLPAALRFLIGFGGENLIPFFTANEYLNFVGLLIVIFGVVFELPLLLYFLGLAEVVTVEGLRKYRRHAIVGIVVVAAVATPSQDPYTMLAMSVPLYLFYEADILLLSLRAKRKARTRA